jgi:hypothetical protein
MSFLLYEQEIDKAIEKENKLHKYLETWLNNYLTRINNLKNNKHDIILHIIILCVMFSWLLV